MIRALLPHRLRHHAQRLCHFIFPKGYVGEFFLCGGAFKPLIRRDLPINDLDIWVRNRADREHLCAALLERGAFILRDFHPYCTKLRLEGQIVEITYHNVGSGGLSDVLNTFDLAINGMGARYQNGHVQEICISEACWNALHHREIHVLEPYYEMLESQRHPSLLRTLHRMGHVANELRFDVHLESEHRLWNLFWNHYTEEDRKRARDLYFTTMVTHHSTPQDHLVRRSATAGYAPLPKSAERDIAPLEYASHAISA